jgi:predicted ATPase
VAPAIELFAQRARQAYLGFSLSAEMPHVQRICDLVEGLPLGIELAAAWVRTIPCGEIAAAIEREAGVLRSAHRNRPARHRNLEAVVAYSWNLLRAEQQSALAGLGLFAGGFTREAAERVAEAPLRTLSLLADKALVRRAAEGRYHLHELVRQFALARLQKMRATHAAVDKRHADFFAALLLRASVDARGPDEVAAAALFRTELANVFAAWSRSVDAGRREVVEVMAAPLIAMLHTRALVREALAEGERAVEALGTNGRDDVLAMVRMQLGRAAVTGGKPDMARRELEAALTLARAGGRPDIIARCLYYRAGPEYHQGNLETAQRFADEALALGANSADPEIRTLVHNLCGTLANMHSRFDVAEDHLRQALAAAREQGAPSLIGGMLCSVNVPLYYRGSFAEAASLSLEAAHIYERLGRTPIATQVRSNLAAILLAQGDAAGAQTHAEVAVRLSRESGDDNMLSGSLATLADVLSEQERWADARPVAEEAEQLAGAWGNALHVTEAEFLLATIELREGRNDRALAHILRLRDALAEHRLTVRVPMLILAAADWAAAVDALNLPLARRWVEAVCDLDDVDASLRDKGRRFLARHEAKASDIPPTGTVRPTLAELEGEVVAFLTGVQD